MASLACAVLFPAIVIARGAGALDISVTAPTGWACFATDLTRGARQQVKELHLRVVMARHGNIARMRLMYAPELASLAEPEREQLLIAMATMISFESWQQMRGCFDPEIPINIVDLGLIYDCSVVANDDGTRSVDVKMTLTAPGCGMGEVLVQDVKDKIEVIPNGIAVDLERGSPPLAPWKYRTLPAHSPASGTPARTTGCARQSGRPAGVSSGAAR